MNVHITEAKRILVANDRGGYTVPTDRLYPFQWNWDSAFVAMGFALYDTDRAYRELERLIEGQWADGMVPHIVFHQPSDTYFPGPNVWRTRHTIPTSGITQPPVFAIALRKVFEAAGSGAEARTLPLYEAALKWHRWWYSARDPEGTGLVALLHPWESGSDNSPAWDIALARVPTTTDTPVVRKDTGHVNASMRPRDEDYSRFIHLVDTYATCGWDPAKQWEKAPFKVAEIQTTAILLKAGEDLEHLAREFGRMEDAAEIAAFNELSRKAILAQWRPALSRFVSRDLISGEDIEAATQAGFIPLLSLDLEKNIAEALVDEMKAWSKGLKVAFPTTKPGISTWEPKRYWRGPAWAIINWLLIDGFKRNGHPEAAEELRISTVAAIEAEGFAEYFDPVTGEGCGGLGFSWTAAAYMWLTST
ncbi:MGH1-like glycoside hydrolase domain-containing protein [Neorhizobium galegae]|uniref:MGH1-like glycoside hydrolase domain-containing protein n=1 Tax=Neorhizobium galegae TaxID=399 RepID=UPI00062196AC|nr:trehalase family glycosidase [Neorhizobium galegae]CDZ58781.1 Glycoside hydrolase family 37 [Neorhizobium galegae bv. orientalis]KAB1121408.1 neutral trehalase [Neorhizobium galegae]MCQ1570588.1 neutral trehalase [Neorhizobium galegae]MCQ1809176.1 neutral trehalase [Neorhizobium galegae]MCQ1838611.1 neutral trehalase [Neorhizobium galegae]